MIEKYQRIEPFIHPKIGEIFKNKEKIFELSLLHNGPIHIIVPEIMTENIGVFRDVFNDLEIDGIIKYAHKSNKSKALLFEAYKNNIGIDVASEEELKNALSVGFTGNKISCTGPKSQSFLFLALSHGCLISIDNLSEISELIKLQNKFQFKNIDIIIRFFDLCGNDRVLIKKNTKFGISQHQIDTLINYIKHIKEIKLKGIHFHYDEHQSEIKSGSIENALDIMKLFFEYGYSPNIIDIGGGFRGIELASKNDFSNYIHFLSESKKSKDSTHTWGDYAYGIKINERGGIDGREFAEKRYREINNYKFLKDILSKNFKNTSLNREINDCMFNIMIEPGYALSNNSGFSIFKVEGYKTISSGDDAIILNGNIFSLSSKMWEYMVDPKHIPLQNNNNSSFYGYILGNLCRDDDVLIRRKIFFDNKPEIGDLIIFFNTSAYASDFEDTNPIMQKCGKKYIANIKDGKINFYEDDLYNLIKF